MHVGDEENTPKQEEIEIDQLLQEIDELIGRSRGQKEVNVSKPTPLSAGLPDEGSLPAVGPTGSNKSTGQAAVSIRSRPPSAKEETAVLRVTGPPKNRESADQPAEQTPGQRPVYNIYILPADHRQITPQDLEHMVPLEITDENDLPAWLAKLQPEEEKPGKTTALEKASENSRVPKHTAVPVQKKRIFPFSIGDAVFYLALIAVVVGVLFFSGNEGGPKSFAGYSVFTVLSSSMESEIPKGSLVVTKQVDSSELQIGDDITYLSNPTTTVTHRIVGITERYADTGQRAFTTQGVMNSAPDKQPVPAANVVGKVIYHSLFLGQAASFLKEHWLILLVLAVLLLGLFRALKVAFGKDVTETEDGLKKPARRKIRQGAIHRRGEKS